MINHWRRVLALPVVVHVHAHVLVDMDVVMVVVGHAGMRIGSICDHATVNTVVDLA